MIALTVSAAAYEALPADWDFSTIGNTEGWTANDSVQEMLVQDGDLCIHIHGGSPAITANSIAVKASDFNVIDIRMKMRRIQQQLRFSGQRQLMELWIAKRQLYLQLSPIVLMLKNTMCN